MPPPDQPFPPMYSDNFDSYPIASEAQYFTDQSGSFEIVKANDSSHGLVMRQMSPQRPVGWCFDAPYPYSVLGDYQWKYVNISADVMIETKGTAYIATGVYSGGCSGSSGSPAVAFGISTNNGGNWSISGDTAFIDVVNKGTLSITPNTWYHLELRILDQSQEGYLNGQLIASTQGLTSHSHGFVAIGSSYDYVQFDNVVIQARPPRMPEQDEEEPKVAIITHLPTAAA